MKKVNIKKFENFGSVAPQYDLGVAGMPMQDEFSGNQRHLNPKEIKKLISESDEVQRKLLVLDLDTRIDALQKLSEFNKEIFESDNNKMEKFGKILDGIGLTTALILSVVGAHQMATGSDVTAVLIGIICSAVISGIGLSIHKKSE